MDKQYESLFQPIRIGSVEVKNRLLMCPMEGTTIINWNLHKGFEESKWDFYMERAEDGIGLLVPGLCTLKSTIGNKWLWKSPEVFEPIKPFMEEIHKRGAKLFLQIGAGWGRAQVVNTQLRPFMANKVLGFFGKPFINMHDVLVSPDADEPLVWMPEFKTRQITVKEIHDFVNAYAQTALLAKNAGIDGVEVHAVHEGYLMDQFTTPYTNHRTDEYGGSFENRYRFAAEVVQEIKKVCGNDFPVSLRYSVVSKTKGFNQGALPGESFVEAGRDMADSERAIRYLEEAGYDMFNCDNGTYDCWYWPHPPVYMPLNCNLEDVEHIRQFTTKPVYCAGRMQIEDGAKAIAEGKLDGLALGRQFLVDNKTVTKIRENRLDDIKPCISCHTGCLPMFHYKGVGLEFPGGNMETGHCALCPRSLSEKKYEIKPAAAPKHIAIIGGGIGGMEMAIQSALRGHTVDLYEKTDKLGGTFIAAAAPSFKEKDRELIAWYRREVAKLDKITVHMNTEIHDLTELQADEIVIATGGKPKSLPLKGWDYTINAADWLLGKKEAGDKVAIIGGGITGCEVAYELALQGKHPFVVEMLEDLMKTDMVPAANSIMLRDLLAYHKVPVYLESKTLEISDHGLRVQTPDGEKFIEADSVIVSVGYTPVNDLFEKDNPHIHVLGDAANIANLKNAIWGANDLAVELSE